MPNHSRHLLIVGDSITLGVAELRGNDIAARVANCYVDRLRPHLPGVKITLDADVHRTTSAARDRIDALLQQHHPDCLLLMLGGNDADLDWRRFVLSEGKVARSRIAVEIYEKNLRLIAGKVLAADATLVLSDIPNHHFELRGPYVSKIAGKDVTAWLHRGGGQVASDRELLKYREAVARVAAELNLPLASYGPALDAQPPLQVVGSDGVHPNDLAHQIIADCLLPVLADVCRIAHSRPISAA